MTFEPDFRYMLDVLANRRPARLAILEAARRIRVTEKVAEVA